MAAESIEEQINKDAQAVNQEFSPDINQSDSNITANTSNNASPEIQVDEPFKAA